MPERCAGWRVPSRRSMAREVRRPLCDVNNIHCGRRSIRLHDMEVDGQHKSCFDHDPEELPQEECYSWRQETTILDELTL